MAVISIVVPVYNEQGNIAELVSVITGLFDSLHTDFEIIFVDDASDDGSLRTIKDMSVNDQRIKYLSFSRNFGQQAALTAGLDFASGDAVITMDADLQDPPGLIPEMLNEWKDGNEIVLMRRRHRNDGIFKRASAGIYYYLLNKFSEYKLPGNVGEFRLIDKKVLEEIRKLREKSRYLRGMIFWMGFKYTFIEYDRPNRKSGETGFSLLKMVRLGMDGILNFSLLPLRLGLILGLLIVFLGFLFLGYIMVDIMLNDVVYQLYKWLSVTTFILTGFMFILIWILGEYIGKIYNEVKNRPIYMIREKGNL